MTCVKLFEHENHGLIYIKNQETRNTYEPHQQTTT